MRKGKIEKSEKETKEIISQPLTALKEKEYLSVKEVAILLSCTPRAINKMINSARLPATRLTERKTIIKRSEFEKLFESPKPEVVYQVEPKKKVYKIEDCYTIAEAEANSQMSSKALYDYIKRNEIPKYQKGKFVYVPKEFIDQLSR